MDKQEYNVSRLKFITCYACFVIAIALVFLVGSLYWEPLHKACVVTALICGPLVAFLHSRISQDNGKWSNIGAMAATILPMIIVSDHFHGYAARFQYLGFFFLAWPLGLLFFESRRLTKSGPAATEKSPDQPI